MDECNHYVGAYLPAESESEGHLIELKDKEYHIKFYSNYATEWFTYCPYCGKKLEDDK